MTDIAPNYNSCLTLNRAELMTRLGITEMERTHPVPVEVEVRFYFAELPPCVADDNGDYICYGQIIDAMRKVAETGEFRLLEFLTMRLHEAIRQELETMPIRNVKIWLRVRKVFLPVPHVKDGASFIYTDLPIDARKVDC